MAFIILIRTNYADAIQWLMQKGTNLFDHVFTLLRIQEQKQFVHYALSKRQARCGL
jgi:hypothetical protein